MQHKVTFAYIVTVSKVYPGTEEEASQSAYEETQKKELDISVTVPDGFTVESITDEDTVWEVEEVEESIDDELLDDEPNGWSLVKQFGKTFVRIVLQDIGEGYNGDYDAEDPNDMPLLRFYGYLWDPNTQHWEDPGNCSYCTTLPANISREDGEIAVELLMEALGEKIVEGTHKTEAETMSWIGTEDIEKARSATK
jgi:hypothetical protein